MGVVFPTKIRRICTPGEDLPARVIVVGLDSAGKTTLVQRFQNLVELQLNSGAAFLDKIVTQPTCVFEVQTVSPRLAPLPLTLWDLGGQEKTRSLWRFYLTDVQGVVFVIDCDDKQRLALARKELLSLSEQIGQDVTIPFVVAANKQDLSRSMSKEELIHALSVPKITSNEWKVFEMCALSGGGVMEMFSYLSEVIHDRK